MKFRSVIQEMLEQKIMTADEAAQSGAQENIKVLSITHTSELTEARIVWLPFEKARDHVRKLNLKNKIEWDRYSASSERPKEIPSSPQRIYGDRFLGWGDFLGTGRVFKRNAKAQYWSFMKARDYARSLDLNNKTEWFNYAKSKEKPREIPTNPSNIYVDEFKGYNDWLGLERKSPKDFWPFEKARAYVRNLGIKSQPEYYAYANSGNKPEEIPYSPDTAYKKEFISYGDWLGTHSIKTGVKKLLFWPYDVASTYARKLNLRTAKEYYNYAKTDKRPIHLPAHPEKTYKGNGWVNWYEWLVGSTRISDDEFNKQYNIQDKPKKYVSFLVAKDLARDLNLSSKEEWYQYIKVNNPKGLPIKPQELYKERWTSWEDFLDIKPE